MELVVTQYIRFDLLLVPSAVQEERLDQERSHIEWCYEDSVGESYYLFMNDTVSCNMCV